MPIFSGIDTNVLLLKNGEKDARNFLNRYYNHTEDMDDDSRLILGFDQIKALS
jgi:hypothetical protein